MRRKLLVDRGFNFTNRGAAGSEHETLDAVMACRFKHVQHANHISDAIQAWVVDRRPYSRICGQVNDHVRPCRSLHGYLFIENVTDNKLHPIKPCLFIPPPFFGNISWQQFIKCANRFKVFT